MNLIFIFAFPFYYDSFAILDTYAFVKQMVVICVVVKMARFAGKEDRSLGIRHVSSIAPF